MIQVSMAIQKGNMPLNIVYMGTSLATPVRINTLTPTGGVIKLISMTRVIIIPNHGVNLDFDFSLGQFSFICGFFF